jgi:hypothetical protein
MLALLERRLDQRLDLRIERLGTGVGGDVAAIAAGAGQHREFVVDVLAVAQHQDAGAIDVEQRGDLRQDALGEPLHRLEVVEGGSRIDDDLQPAPGLHHALELLVAAQRRGQRGEQLVGSELGLGLVVVDVVVDDDPSLRRLAGLAGAQDDADGLVLQFVADVFNQLKPGRVGLHDDVEQDCCDVGIGAHQLFALGARVGREDFQRLPVQHIVAERKPRALVHGRVVVNDGDLPLAHGRGMRPNVIFD